MKVIFSIKNKTSGIKNKEVVSLYKNSLAL